MRGDQPHIFSSAATLDLGTTRKGNMQHPGDKPPPSMVTLAQLAERDGITKGAASRHVARLVERHGLAIVRDRAGRIRMLDISEYDRLRQQVRNPARAQAQRKAPKPPKPKVDSAESYDEALRQKTWVDAERGRLKLQEERGELIRKAELVEAIQRCAAEIVHIVRHDVAAADEIAMIAHSDGANGIRRYLKAGVERRLTEIADSLARLATDHGEAPAA
jgi:hypothetical protein